MHISFAMRESIEGVRGVRGERGRVWGGISSALVEVKQLLIPFPLIKNISVFFRKLQFY